VLLSAHYDSGLPTGFRRRDPVFICHFRSPNAGCTISPYLTLAISGRDKVDAIQKRTIGQFLINHLPLTGRWPSEEEDAAV